MDQSILPAFYLVSPTLEGIGEGRNSAEPRLRTLGQIGKPETAAVWRDEGRCEGRNRNGKQQKKREVDPLLPGGRWRTPPALLLCGGIFSFIQIASFVGRCENRKDQDSEQESQDSMSSAVLFSLLLLFVLYCCVLLFVSLNGSHVKQICSVMLLIDNEIIRI